MLEDNAKIPDMLPKINKSGMTRIMDAIKKYLRSFHGIVRSLLAYVTWKKIIVETYDDYLK